MYELQSINVSAVSNSSERCQRIGPTYACYIRIRGAELLKSVPRPPCRGKQSL